MSMGCLTVPESKEALRKQKDRTCENTPHGPSWNNLSKTINNVKWIYDQNYKINMHESLLIQISE